MANDTHIFPCEKYIYFGGCKKHISFGLFDFIKGQSQLPLNIWNRLIHSTTATVFSLRRNADGKDVYLLNRWETTYNRAGLQRKATWVRCQQFSVLLCAQWKSGCVTSEKLDCACVQKDTGYGAMLAQVKFPSPSLTRHTNWGTALSITVFIGNVLIVLTICPARYEELWTKHLLGSQAHRQCS